MARPSIENFIDLDNDATRRQKRQRKRQSKSVPCAYCGNPFYPFVQRNNNPEHNINCSKRCANLYKAERGREYRRKTFTPLTVHNSYAVIPLTCDKYAKVDIEDWGLICDREWQAQIAKGAKTHYARSSRGDLMHVVLCGIKGVDHRNRNGLDNRRENLRIASKSQNMVNWDRRNKCGFRGVHKQTSGRFQALIRGRGLGTYETAEAAARAFDAAAKEAYGDFAILNFPE